MAPPPIASAMEMAKTYIPCSPRTGLKRFRVLRLTSGAACKRDRSSLSLHRFESLQVVRAQFVLRRFRVQSGLRVVAMILAQHRHSHRDYFFRRTAHRDLTRPQVAD